MYRLAVQQGDQQIKLSAIKETNMRRVVRLTTAVSNEKQIEEFISETLQTNVVRERSVCNHRR